MTIGSRLKTIRKNANLKLIEVGEIFNITAQTLSRYELDQRTPDNDFLHDFGKHFKLNGNWLLYNEPPIYKTDEPERNIKEYFLELSNLINSKDVHDTDIQEKSDFTPKITDDIPGNYLLLIQYMLKYPMIRKGIFQFFFLLLKPLIDNNPELVDTF